MFERHDGISKYINEFAGNLKRNLGKAIKRIRDTVLPLIPNDIVEMLRRQLRDQSHALCFEPGSNIDDALNLRVLQIRNEKNPA